MESKTETKIETKKSNWKTVKSKKTGKNLYILEKAGKTHMIGETKSHNIYWHSLDGNFNVFKYEICHIPWSHNEDRSPEPVEAHYQVRKSKFDKDLIQKKVHRHKKFKEFNDILDYIVDDVQMVNKTVKVIYKKDDDTDDEKGFENLVKNVENKK